LFGYFFDISSGRVSGYQKGDKAKLLTEMKTILDELKLNKKKDSKENIVQKEISQYFPKWEKDK
jgi:hypothetical protein